MVPEQKLGHEACGPLKREEKTSPDEDIFRSGSSTEGATMKWKQKRETDSNKNTGHDRFRFSPCVSRAAGERPVRKTSRRETLSRSTLSLTTSRHYTWRPLLSSASCCLPVFSPPFPLLTCCASHNPSVSLSSWKTVRCHRDTFSLLCNGKT